LLWEIVLARSFLSQPRRIAAFLIALFFASLLLLNFSAAYADRPAANAPFYFAPTAKAAAIAPADFFGVVGRDPWYDFNTDPTNPGKPNLAMQESLAQQISLVGARWVRIEFHTESRWDVRGGYIDYGKYDAFINDIAPRYNLKVLALVGADIVSGVNATDADLVYTHLNDPADRPDGTNNYTRFFANRVKEIADHYGDKIGAYEILNEPNSWYGFKANPENIGALMGLTYGLTKPAHPSSSFILGATIATGDPRLDHVSYLTGIYASKTVQNYKQNGAHFEGNLFPFDGVAWHPYFPSAWDSLYTVDQAVKVMRAAGDGQNKIWVTETGYIGNKDNSNCANQPGSEDLAQDQYLRIFYEQAAQRQPDIANVFWFKFEDFYVDGQLVPMGLIHLSTNQYGFSPHGGKITRYKPAYATYMQLAAPTLPIGRVAPPTIQYSAANRSAPYYFDATGHTLSGPFLNYWLKNGGLDLFGYPVTEPYQEIDPGTGRSYTVQWFERERFEYHPENKAPYDVLLGLLGNELISRACRSFAKADPIPLPPAPPTPTPEKGKPTPKPVPTPKPDRVYFKETGHNLVGVFKDYWEQRGGLAIFGYPISEEFGETNPADGQFYVVQYFERARFEYHPEKKGTPYEVELGLLGRQALANRYWR
jgi:hypothetical protein